MPCGIPSFAEFIPIRWVVLHSIRIRHQDLNVVTSISAVCIWDSAFSLGCWPILCWPHHSLSLTDSLHGLYNFQDVAAK